MIFLIQKINWDLQCAPHARDIQPHFWYLVLLDLTLSFLRGLKGNRSKLPLPFVHCLNLKKSKSMVFPFRCKHKDFNFQFLSKSRNAMFKIRLFFEKNIIFFQSFYRCPISSSKSREGHQSNDGCLLKQDEATYWQTYRLYLI